jgi:hypothetical protein
LTLLTLRDAEKIGIEVSPFEQQTPTPKIAPRVTSRETSTQEMTSRARLFVKEMYSRSSRTNAVGWLGPLYADEVIYDGKPISRREVITKRGLFTEAWPERSFSIPDKSMNAVCGEVPVECIVTGTVETAVRSLSAQRRNECPPRFHLCAATFREHIHHKGGKLRSAAVKQGRN